MTDSTVVLSAIDNSNKKAVLNLKTDSENCAGSVRLYNFKGPIRGILTLGFLINNEVYKAALTEKDISLYTFSFRLNGNFSSFSCALINIQGGEATPILLGSTEKKTSPDLTLNLVKNFKYLDQADSKINEIKEALDNSGIDYDDTEKEEIEKSLNLECNDDKCIKCGYRNAFYSNFYSNPEFIVQNQEKECEKNEKPDTKNLNPDNFNKRIQSLNEGTFYNEIKNQLDLLFERYPEETFLNEVIPNSRWAKVDYENDGHYIVIGLIYDDKNNVQYVCYGSPGEYSSEPPKEFNGLCQWLPLDVDKADELGYWIIYQDAESGKNVEVEVS